MSKFANICERNNAIGNLYWLVFFPLNLVTDRSWRNLLMK